MRGIASIQQRALLAARSETGPAMALRFGCGGVRSRQEAGLPARGQPDSALSWIAPAGDPLVPISGSSRPTNAFATLYRVINRHFCNGCRNEVRHWFDHKDCLWCPRHAGTPSRFGCSSLITPQQVSGTIRRMPAFTDNGNLSPGAGALRRARGRN
jgi:hypothetical protein